MSIPLRWRCSLTTCVLLGSSFLAHASPLVSADCSEPTQEGRSPACRVASRRGHPGDLCMKPRTCCLNVLAHGVPVCLAGRIDRPGTLLAFLGSWSPTPPRTKDRRSVCLCTVLPNPCWKRLSWQPSFCAPCLRSRLALARGGPYIVQGWYTGPSHHYAVCPWRQAVNGTLCFCQNWMGRMWGRMWSRCHNAQQFMESFARTGGPFLEGSRVALNCHRSLRWNSCCHLHWVNNCAQERKSLAGWQYALGKVDLEPQAT